MDECTKLASRAIEYLQTGIKAMGFDPVVQFELEGTYLPVRKKLENGQHALDFEAINRSLSNQNILGECKAEYWEYQWEWASTMSGQSPLTAAKDLATVMQVLPDILCQNGAREVHIQPVFWQTHQLNRPLLPEHQSDVAVGKKVHIPNAIQLNISANNKDQDNALLENDLGHVLQNLLLHHSYECCYLFAPEQAAFSRLHLKEDYDLHRELTSPTDLSGGHQGSIAFYQHYDKHNLPVGNNWRQLARVEHRLGSASTQYNPFVNCAFALANLWDAIDICQQSKQDNIRLIEYPAELPKTLDQALEIFANGTWFERRFNQCQQACPSGETRDLGTALKIAILQSSE